MLLKVCVDPWLWSSTAVREGACPVSTCKRSLSLVTVTDSHTGCQRQSGAKISDQVVRGGTMHSDSIIGELKSLRWCILF